MPFSVVLQVLNDHNTLMGRALTGNKHKFKMHFNHLSKHPANETVIGLRFFKNLDWDSSFLNVTETSNQLVYSL